jgi:hypothetical protein
MYTIKGGTISSPPPHVCVGLSRLPANVTSCLVVAPLPRNPRRQSIRVKSRSHFIFLKFIKFIKFKSPIDFLAVWTHGVVVCGLSVDIKFFI